MSIADRINSMAQNLSSAYGRIAYLGVDLSEVDKNMQNLSTVLDTVYNDYPKVSDEGITPGLSGSKIGRLNTTLKASDTTQFTTTGKQLFNVNSTVFLRYANITINGNDITISATQSSSNGGLLWNVPVTVGEAITISYGDMVGASESGNNNVNYRFSDTPYTAEDTWEYGTAVDKTSKTVTVTPTAQYLLLSVRVANGGTYTVSDLMVRPASITDDTYEPYTNGTSPNPDYPQDIHVVKGNNTVEVCGKNLWGGFAPFTAKPVGGTFTTNTDGSITATASNLTKSIYSCDGTQVNNHNLYQELEPGTYTVSVQGEKPDYVEYQLYELPSNSTTLSLKGSFAGNNTKTFTLTEKAKIGLRLRVNVGAELDNYTFKIMIERGSEATAYEPYTSVMLPIGLPVQNLLPTDENVWEQGTISGTTGANQDSTTRIRTIDYYPIKNDTDYYVSVQDTNYCFLNIILYDTSKNCVGAYYTISTLISGATSLKINIPSSTITNVAYMRVTLRKAAGATSDTILPSEVSIIKPMIELGDKPNRYTPYGVAPIELCKIGDCQDKLFKAISGDTVYDTLTSEQKEGLANSGWYKYEMIRKVVLDGSENWGEDTEKTLTQVFRYSIQPSAAAGGIRIWSDKFIYNQLGDTEKIASSTGRLYIAALKTRASTAEDFKTWLSTHNTTAYYAVATPVITQITDTILISQLEALYKAQSKNGQTNVLQTNADIPFTIYASALKGE